MLGLVGSKEVSTGSFNSSSGMPFSGKRGGPNYSVFGSSSCGAQGRDAYEREKEMDYTYQRERIEI